EGKSIPEVKQKVEMAFLPVYMRSMCVFGPTAALNFTLIPPQHRLTVAQIVGLGEYPACCLALALAFGIRSPTRWPTAHPHGLLTHMP
ncbi:Mpv17/PMP22 family protein, partial [Klebsiella pneumoniae]|uniref:Mpv17/PMP22 family protein n=1 Tax=Klebsiella pneumoniae TaxID=573 RepID=UPI00254ACF9C